jgi:hypothetical protein
MTRISIRRIMKKRYLNEEGAWHLESACHSVITQNIIISTVWESSDKALFLVSEERESDGMSHRQRNTPIHNL